MKTLLSSIIILLLSQKNYSQNLCTLNAIDSFITSIENDKTLKKRVKDTVSYEKYDGSKEYDSAYSHSEYYYKNNQIVKIVSMNKFGNWRTDMTVYYFNDKPIRFSKGESFKRDLNDPFDFHIYYCDDNAIKTTLTDKGKISPSPDVTVGMPDVKIFLYWSYQLLNNQ